MIFAYLHNEHIFIKELILYANFLVTFLSIKELILYADFLVAYLSQTNGEHIMDLSFIAHNTWDMWYM